MLLLDWLTVEARIGVIECGFDTETFDIMLDLDHDGNFGEIFLAFCAADKKLYAMFVTSDNDTVEKRKKRARQLKHPTQKQLNRAGKQK